MNKSTITAVFSTTLSKILKYSFALFSIAPLYIAIIYACKSPKDIAYTGLSFPKSIHWYNFVEGIRISNFFLALKNSFISTVSTVVLLTFVCGMASYIIARRNKSRGYTAVYYLFLGAILIPFQSIMLPLYINLRSLGLLNTLPGFIFTRSGFLIAYNTLIMTGFVKSVPLELEEAAQIDGASKYMTFWRIVFPLMKPIVVTSVIINALYTWNDFIISIVILQKDHVRTLPLTQFYFFGENSSELGMAFAVMIMSITPLLILYLLLQKHIIEGLTAGSVKG